MDAFFAELDRTVLQRWKRENFSLAKFPEIARVALDERPLLVVAAPLTRRTPGRGAPCARSRPSP